MPLILRIFIDALVKEVQKGSRAKEWRRPLGTGPSKASLEP